ncbi:MAG: helix-turn-helix transcriptional regulator, partial [Chloroflexota bacterium]
QQYLANRMEISPAAVSQWRTGKRVPDIATLHLIRQTLDLEQYELEKLLEAWLTTRISSDLLIYLNIHKDEAYHLETINNVLNKLWLKEFFAIDY